MENWNDDRLDELSRRMDAGFAATATRSEVVAAKEEMNHRFDESDRRFDRVEGQLDRVNNRLDYMLGGMFLAGMGLLANLLADKI